MPYQKKPAPAKLSKSQKKDWDMNEEARYQRSLKEDKRSMSDIAPAAKVESMAPAKDAEKASQAGSERQKTNAESIVKELQKKKHPTTYFGK